MHLMTIGRMGVMAVKERDPDREQMFDIRRTWGRSLPPASEEKGWCAGKQFYRHHPGKSRTRCPSCNRLLFLQEEHCIGGEILGYRLPPHKVKVATKKMPNKQPSSKMGRKGRK